MAVTITGLEGNYLALNNPIYIKIESDADRAVVMSIDGKVGSELVFQVVTGLPLYVDISDYIKSYMEIPEMDWIDTAEFVLSNESIASFKLVFMYRQGGRLEQQEFEKIFIRGGYFDGINNEFSDGMILKDSYSIPCWDGYPCKMFTVIGDQIKIEDVKTGYKDERRRLNSCHSVYLGWLNSKGGFSYWLFDSYRVRHKYSGSETINRNPNLDLRYSNFDVVGGVSDATLTLTTRAEQEYYNVMKSLSGSPVVYVLDLHKIMDTSFGSPKNMWTKVKNSGNNHDREAGESVKEFTFNFDLLLTEKRRFGW